MMGAGPAGGKGTSVHPAVAVALLVLGVVAILAPRPAWLGWVGPPVLAAVAVATGVVSPAGAGRAVRPLGAPVAFVVCAVPFAVLLDRLGLFRALADRTDRGRRRLGVLWVLAGLVVALLNLDAAVVLLTPLYLRLAARGGGGKVLLGIQPLLLSCLASSALPISNLTNLIAGSALHLSSGAFLAHLGPPTLAASAVGYLAYRRQSRRLALLEPAAAAAPPAVAGEHTGDGPPRPDQVGDRDADRARLADVVVAARAAAGRPTARPPAARQPAPGGGGASRRVLLGGLLAAAVVAGFLLTPSIGGQPWEVAAAGDLALAALLRTLPLSAIPWRVVLTVLGLGVLASGAAGPLHVDALVANGSPAGMVRDAAFGAAGGSLFNNLPALLVALPALAHRTRAATWAVLLGVNVGPLAVPSGTLAGLLWLETMRRLGAPLRERDYLRLAWRVALPGLVAGLAVLLALRAVLGPG